jgi:hypothetical protein
MIEELDVVALKRDRPDLGLKAGEQGAVVLVYDGAYEVEFVNEDGSTRVMTAFAADDVELVWRVATIRDVEPRRAKSA